MRNAAPCAAFERWLDEGADAANASGMRAHAAACIRCGEMLAAMEAVDAWLSEPPNAPLGLGERVMARIGRLEAGHRVTGLTTAPVDEMPWWAGILQQPAVVLAAAVAALMLWRADVLIAVVTAAATWLSTAAPAASAHALDTLAQLARGSAGAASARVDGHNLVSLGLALGLTPLLAYASFAAGGWVARVVARSGLARS